MAYDLASLGWDAGFAAAYTEFATATADQRPGRVVRVGRGVCSVLTESGPVRASLAGAVLSAAGQDPAALPVAGDWVVVRAWPDRRITAEAVLPRRSVVVGRTASAPPASHPAGRVLAANIDVVAVVAPVDPPPDLAGVARLLVLAQDSGAEPLLLLSKSDLAADPDAVARRVAGATAGVAVLPVSAATGAGLAALRERVPPGRTVALLGPPGAGRSTLAGALGSDVLTVVLEPDPPGATAGTGGAAVGPRS